MTQYVQYDEDGNITAVVSSACSAPDCERQLAFEEPQDLRNKKVNTGTLELTDVAPEPIPEPMPEAME